MGPYFSMSIWAISVIIVVLINLVSSRSNIIRHCSGRSQTAYLTFSIIHKRGRFEVFSRWYLPLMVFSVVHERFVIIGSRWAHLSIPPFNILSKACHPLPKRVVPIDSSSSNSSCCSSSRRRARRLSQPHLETMSVCAFDLRLLGCRFFRRHDMVHR